MRNHIAATIATAGISLMALNAPTVAKPQSDGPQRIAADWYRHDKKLGCVSRDGLNSFCTVSPDTEFKPYESADHKAALVLVSYLTDPTGNDSVTAGIVLKRSPEQDRWVVVKKLYNIGQEPSGVTFGDNKVSFNVKTFRKSDPHCCPTGNKTIVEAIR